jgi:hypothetical protein
LGQKLFHVDQQLNKKIREFANYISLHRFPVHWVALPLVGDIKGIFITPVDFSIYYKTG